MQLAPVVLFVYNRPYHTLQTLNALANNLLADKSVLYIYSDGPKPGASFDEELKVVKVREIVRLKKWCKEVYVIEASKNLGLAQSVVIGVSEIVERYGRVIVLEDDIVTSISFLTFMNKALEKYQENEIVFQVSGFMIPNREKLVTTFFYRAPASWGWATWKRSWRYYENNPSKLLKKIDELNRYKFNIDDTYNYYKDLCDNTTGHLETWAVRWYASLFIQNGLCLWPSKSLVRNIGHDGSGENCNTIQPYYLNQKLYKNVRLTNIPIKESTKAVTVIKRFYTNRQIFLQEQASFYSVRVVVKKIKIRFKILLKKLVFWDDRKEI